MKLRNKRTGEIWDIGKVLTNDYPSYDTLEQITEDFEDYNPAKPLIKDEKIRKAVRAWANSFDDVDEIKASDDYKEFWIDGYLIEFERSFNEVESEHTYRRTNIAELCGEEEE